MKKSIFFIVALAIVSCQDNSELKLEYNESSQNIPFTFNAFSNKATKADSHNNLEFFYKTFNVYGWKKVNSNWVNVFNNVTNEYFAADGNGTVVYATGDPVSDEWGTIQGGTGFPGWYYQNIRFWDKFATDYQFSAYAPIAASTEVAATSDGVIKIGSSTAPVTVESTNLMATPAKELAYKGFTKDYMTATSVAKTSAVNLVFSHELAKFNVKLILDDLITTKQNVTVNEVSLLNLNGTSYYDSSKETASGYLSAWATPTTELIYTANGVGTATAGYQMNGETAGSDNYDGYYVMERLMIPQTAVKAVDSTSGDAIDCQITEFTEACVYVKYTIGSEPFEGYYALANLFLGTGTGTSFNFEGGNEYTLNITVGPRPIFFTVEVNTWVNHDAALAAN